jgi:hypothetical protein
VVSKVIAANVVAWGNAYRIVQVPPASPEKIGSIDSSIEWLATWEADFGRTQPGQPTVREETSSSSTPFHCVG